MDSANRSTENEDAGRVDGNRASFKKVVLLGAVFFISICGLVYELIAGTVSAYLLGSAVTQFSLVIGGFLFAMGVGAYLTRFLEENLLDTFVRIELLLGIVGGGSALFLFLSFTYLSYYLPVLYLVTLLVGMFIGMEIPLVVRLLNEQLELRVNVASVLGLDYVGALVASVAFPLLVLPYLGQIGASFLFGLMNVGVAGLCCLFLGDAVNKRTSLLYQSSGAGLLLLAGLVFSGSLVGWVEGAIYKDTVIYRHQSPYQKIVLTRWRDDVRLFLDGNLQFSTVDEHRFHEPLVHTAMGMPGRRQNVLILGGGDGLSAREVLKYDDVKRVDVVDLDPAVTDLFARRDLLTDINNNALNHEKVEVQNRDAMKFLEERANDPERPRYDRVILDFPDPNSHSIARLYTVEFYRLLVKNMTWDGVFVTQATSPFLGTRSFWCIYNTITSVTNPGDRNSGLYAKPFQSYVPSFGTWGFIVASPAPISLKNWSLKVNTRYLSPDVFGSMFSMPKDVQKLETKVNHLNNHVLVQYYERDWGMYNE